MQTKISKMENCTLSCGMIGPRVGVSFGCLVGCVFRFWPEIAARAPQNQPSTQISYAFELLIWTSLLPFVPGLCWVCCVCCVCVWCIIIVCCDVNIILFECTADKEIECCSVCVQDSKFSLSHSESRTEERKDEFKSFQIEMNRPWKSFSKSRQITYI